MWAAAALQGTGKMYFEYVKEVRQHFQWNYPPKVGAISIKTYINKMNVFYNLNSFKGASMLNTRLTQKLPKYA